MTDRDAKPAGAGETEGPEGHPIECRGAEAERPPFALLLARQRSGTGALGSVLDRQSALKYVGEVFHPANEDEADNFFTFLRACVERDTGAAMPDAHERLFDGFLDMLAERYPGRLLVIDVKYRSLHHLAGGWCGLLERPWLIRHAIARRAAIIHLTRRNFVESFVSGRLAEANRVWHARPSDTLDVRSTVIDIRALSHYIETTADEVALMERWLPSGARTVTFDYAEMFDPAGNLAEAQAARLSRLLQMGVFENRAPSFVKQAPAALSQAIENIALVRRALSGTPHAWMVEEVRQAG